MYVFMNVKVCVLAYVQSYMHTHDSLNLTALL